MNDMTEDAVDGVNPTTQAFGAMATAAIAMERRLRRLERLVGLNMGLLIGLVAYLAVTR